MAHGLGAPDRPLAAESAAPRGRGLGRRPGARRGRRSRSPLRSDEAACGDSSDEAERLRSLPPSPVIRTLRDVRTAAGGAGHGPAARRLPGGGGV
eukprot:3823300-Alexandrium_andersonii.AAC.1